LFQRGNGCCEFPKTPVGTCLGVRKPGKYFSGARGVCRYLKKCAVFSKSSKQGWYHQTSVPSRMEDFFMSENDMNKNEVMMMGQKDKQFVEKVTAMEDDFAQWYTDVVKQAELVYYGQVRGTMIIKPYGLLFGKIFAMNWTESLRKPAIPMLLFHYSFRK